MVEQENKPAIGWAEFLSNKSAILDDYLLAKIKGRNRPVQVEHGFVAEASLRRWLGEFLPKKYGVTSGYILSQGTQRDEKLRHYDVIIYDRLEAPTLWTDQNPDTAQGGHKRAIPAEHVFCVLEVKSTLNKATVLAARDKLLELAELAAKIDEPDDPYKKYLHKNFCSAVIFIEQTKSESLASSTYINELMPLVTNLRGFFGGLILLGEGLDEKYSGSIEILSSKDHIDKTTDGRPFGFSVSEGISFSLPDETIHLSTMTMWTEINFATFAFGLVKRMAGEFRQGYAPSFHGMPFKLGV